MELPTKASHAGQSFGMPATSTRASYSLRELWPISLPFISNINVISLPLHRLGFVDDERDHPSSALIATNMGKTS